MAHHRNSLEYKKQLAAQFARDWQQVRDENSEAKSFWDAFFRIFNLDRFRLASFEYRVKHRAGTTKFADVFWPGKLLCEHKSAGKDLDAAFVQALGYVEEIRRQNPEDVPRYIIVCDFARMVLHDLQKEEKIEFVLSELPTQIQLGNLDFMDGIEKDFQAAQEKANIDAADAVGKLYAEFAGDENIDREHLKLVFIRLLFCFFADDTLIFNPRQFQDYISHYTRPDGTDLAGALDRIFDVLNTPENKRQKNLHADLRAFPYVNGQLFQQRLQTPEFNAAQRAQLIACAARDWAGISPEIFGTLFQSVMNKTERRGLGAHYTEESNILKVIDSLFMDDLRADFETARAVKNKAARQKALMQLHNKIEKLQLLDPACGCGNFLIVAYRELRRLEDDILEALFPDRRQMQNVATLVRVKISQFHGIELEEYPAQIAKVAMWLTDHQCNSRTALRFGETRPTIPLNDAAQILCANALQIAWPAADFIFGNPPFIGRQYQSTEQKSDMEAICKDIKSFGVLDYVCNWHVKAVGIMKQNRHVKAAFVSTNSICQGEQVGILWPWILKQGFEIIFAHRTFQWISQAPGKAAVHCIIVGFCLKDVHQKQKRIFVYPDIKGLGEKQIVQNINPYLVDAPSIAIEKRKNQISGELEVCFGSMPNDGGHLLLSPEEKENLIQKEPMAAKYIRPFLGAEEFINGKERWCLWFAGVSEVRLNHDASHMPQVAARIAAVKQHRQSSTRQATQKLAATAHLFGEIRQPESGNYIAIPEVSSETRAFIPMDFLPSTVIASNKLYTLDTHMPLYHFGILCSSMHNAFMRTVAGRLKSDYQYSAGIVYNNFPFPFTFEEREKASLNADISKHIAQIEKAAQRVLDARAYYRAETQKENLPAPTLADFYKPQNTFTQLQAAHQALDKAVDAAYGYTGASDDAPRVAFLFGLYAALAGSGEKPKAQAAKKPAKSAKPATSAKTHE